MASESDSPQPVERTPAESSAPGEGTSHGECASEPVAWVAFADDASESGVTALNREAIEEVAAKFGWNVAPLYRSPECPYVTGTVTRYCTLTPFALTDAEREALEIAFEYVGSAYAVEHHAATLRGLLERTQKVTP